MIRRLFATIALAALSTSATARISGPMTFAEAKKLSPGQLAERFLGKAADPAGYVEADVRGNGGLMIHMPGLNGIDLFKRPQASGFAGLCAVDGVHLDFETSSSATPGDPPHRVRDTWKFRRFAWLGPTAASDGAMLDRACAALAPVIGRTDPMLFSAKSGNAADAWFAMRAVARAQAAASALGDMVSCDAGVGDKVYCADPAAALTSIPIGRIHVVDAAPCPTGTGRCVHTIWEKAAIGKDALMVELDIRTDASGDPNADFNVVAVAIKSGIWIFD